MTARCRILLRAKEKRVLTNVAEGICGLLHPLAWQHVYVPVLPHSLSGYLDAPMPYLMGLPTGVSAPPKSLFGWRADQDVH